jgi:bis(5'-adenosyl)-triphosphatase
MSSLRFNGAFALGAAASAMLLVSALAKTRIRSPQRPLAIAASGATSSTLPGRGGPVQFGKYAIPRTQLFFESNLTLAIVNLRPIVPGHVLVLPRRVVARIRELTEEENADLWRSVRDISIWIEVHYSATACNIAVQDGAAAGQTVRHVHVHILPRKPADFERSDDVYDALEHFDGSPAQASRLHVPADEDRKDRTPEQMAEEATRLRSLVPIKYRPS